MYTENEKHEINWGLIIKRGLIAIGVILVILLIIWLISGIRNNTNDKPEVDNKKVQEVENGSLETYSEKFINNIRYMQEVAKNYWLVGGEIPTDGNSVQLSLQELIARGLILPFTDQNGKSCDTNSSYVRLTNNNGKYNMSIKLSCDTETATINEEIGCNQLCGNACEPEKKQPTKPVVKNTKTQYEHKQAYTVTAGNYVCSNGTLSGDKCYTIETKNSNKVENITCPKNYKYNKNTKQCETTGTNNKVIDADRTTSWKCPSGYEKVGFSTNSYCIKESKDSMKATPVYICEDSTYKLNGTTCTKNIVDQSKMVSVKGSTTYTCPSGYSKTGSGANTKCTKKTSGKKYFSKMQNLGSNCQYLGRKAKDNCKNNCNVLYYTYYCTESLTIAATPTTTGTSISCKDGYKLVGNACTKTDTKQAKLVYDCPFPYEPQGNKCYYYDTKKVDSTKKTKYSCPSGYTRNGSKCYPNNTTKTVKPTITYNYTCDNGYNKSGSGASSKCYKKIYTNATKTSSNVTKYKYTWSDSKSLNGWTATGRTRKVNA